MRLSNKTMRLICAVLLASAFLGSISFGWSMYDVLLNSSPRGIEQSEIDFIPREPSRGPQTATALMNRDSSSGRNGADAVELLPTSDGWNIDYLPTTINHMNKYYKDNLLPASLRMMLAPSAYASSRMSCPALVQRHVLEYGQVIERIDFTRPPKYKMPWYFHDPFALCGRYQLTHLVGGVPQFVHRLVVLPAAIKGDTSDGQMVVATVTAGVVSSMDIAVEHCGRCQGVPLAERWSCDEDIFLQARLVGETSVVSAVILPITPSAGGPPRNFLQFLLPDAGEYILEVKVVHVNGSSSNASHPKSLGVIGIRASDHNRKSFKYNLACDMQRHVYGSPLKVVALAPPQAAPDLPSVKPLCSNATFVQGIGLGRWVRIPYGTQCDQVEGGRYCLGDPQWLSDACAFNHELVWVPDSCKMRIYSPPKGPEASCLKRGRSAFLLLVGDSVTREYMQNCRLFDFRSAKLHCLFANIALEGQHYSLDYAKAVVKAMIEALTSNKPGVFASNLGIHHMIGKSSTEQWIEFIDLFVAAWKDAKFEVLPIGNDRWMLEKAVWLGPPTIQYARHGMGYQRGALWDAIAWEKLKPLGFIRLYAIAPTLSRTEATWDGLHYASQKGKVQSPWRNKAAPVLLWNGGVANMLFNMLLNLICNEDEAGQLVSRLQ